MTHVRQIRVLALMILAAVIAAVVSCGAPKPVFDISSVTSYRDIPGVTADEIAAIEALKNSRQKFTYGQLRESEVFALPGGTYGGFAPKFCELLSGLFGIDFVMELYDWTKLTNIMDGSTVDFTGDLTPTDERRERYYMTRPIAERSMRLFILSERDGLYDAAMNFLRGSVDYADIMRQYPGLVFDLVGTDELEAVADMMRTGKIDAFVAEGVLAILFDKISGEILGANSHIFHIPVSMSTAKAELQPIISVMEKYLMAGGLDVVYELYRQGETEYSRHVFRQTLADDERAWADALAASGGKVPIALQSDNYPISFFNNQEQSFQGIAVDLLTEISKLTGIEFEVKNDRHTPWPELLKSLNSGEVSLLSQLLYSEDRANSFLWTKNPYFTSRYAFLSKKDYPDVKMYQVPQKTVGIARNTVYEEMYRTWFADDSNVLYLGTVHDVLDALERGDIDLALVSEYMLGMLTHYFERTGYKANLIVPGSSAVTFFGINIKETELKSILEKALSLLDTEIIGNSWVTRVYDYNSQMTRQRMLYLAIIATILGALLLLIAVFLHKNRKINRDLDKKVKMRTRELELQTEAAQAASRSKSAFLANMSHEIRTPMNSIIGFSELTLSIDIPPKAREYIGKISESAELLLEIISDILDISKIESGKMEIENVRFDLRDVFAYCEMIVRSKAEEKGLTLVCRVDPTLENELVGDSLRLRQALLNVLSNAVKFTEAGRVELSASIIDRDGGSVTIRFEVRDTGIGMSLDQSVKIFEPFMQADNSITRKYGGTGLGLAITKSIVDIMGGELKVESVSGMGSIFSFDLKFGVGDGGGESARAESSREIEVPEFEGEILVCEDNYMNQQVIGEHLGNVGLKAVIAENGRVGVEIISKRMKEGGKPFDLILMDVHMPVMDGLEATRRMKELGVETPIVAVTADLITQNREFYKLNGMADSLGKPFKTRELHELLTKYCRVVGVSHVDGDRQAADEKKLLACLKLNFVKSNQSVYVDIVNALDADDVTLAHRLAHTLKSNAAQIGADSLRQAAAAVEDALVGGKNRLSGEQLPALERELKSMLEELAPLLDQANAQCPAQDMSPEKRRELFRRLQEMLDNRNPECMNLTADIRGIPGTEDLVRLIEDFEFQQAAELLAEFREKTLK